MMKTKTMIILSAIASSIGLYLIYRLYKTKNTPTSDKVTATDYNTSKEGVFTITKPIDNNKKYDVIYVFGGMSYATPEWMLQQMPKEIFLNNIVVASSYLNSLNSAEKALKKYLDDNSIDKNRSSIIGFSAGGYNVLDNYSNNLKFVGLIDPSNKSKYNTLNFGSNTRMIYNKQNWGAYPSIKANMDLLATEIKKGGGEAEIVSISHKEIPKYFFNKHKKDLIK